ncbi:MAG: hypothetical protein GXP37_05640 [Chloroflexi bacterium]|nr:hypothetical protein [Chloroflexota bacterium]
MFTKTKLRWSLLIFVLLLLMPGLVLAQGSPPLVEESGVAPLPETREASLPSATTSTDAYAVSVAWDSGWVNLAPGQALQLQHDLGGDIDDYVVDMQYRNRSNGVNQRYYGGTDFGTQAAPGASVNDRVGAYWRSLTTSTITVYRRPEDLYADAVRIRIWGDAHPDYDSGWLSLTPGAAATTLNHNLGGNADDYVVDMQYRNVSSGVNQRFYGGADFGATSFSGARNDDRVGLYWRSLTNASITLFRRAEDNYAANVRIRIWQRPSPTYDSGWVNINPDTAVTLLHRIGGNADDYVVDMQYRSGSSGVNQRYYGGTDFGSHPPSGMNENDRVGAYWRSLNKNSITVYRRPEDIYAPEVRIRIWHFWQPTAPNYDSGWVALGAGGPVRTLTHNLGGDSDHYLVDTQYLGSSGNGVNLRYYGGADFGTHPAPGHAADDRVAAYWRSLTNTSITLFRRAEDNYAARIRIRIWKMPKPDYDSGWVAISQNQAKTLTHNLGNDTGGSLIDLEYRSGGSGINQRYFGGADFGSHPPGGMNENDRVGAYWRSLSTSTITVYRRPEDVYAPEVRVRIWRMARPSYNGIWRSVGQGTALTLTHNLYGDPANYFMTTWQLDSGSNGINLRHFGGADFGSNPPGGYAANDRVGAYWRSLTNTSLTLYRRPEDGFADFVRVRIWDTNQNVYLPAVMRE